VYRENRKRAIDLQKTYNDESVDTKIIRGKLVFKGTGHTHKEKVVIPKADTVLTANRGHCVGVNPVKEAREANIQILRDPDIAKANHNVLSCIYINGQRELKDSVDDDMEYGAARKILNIMQEKELSNVLVIVSRWNPTQQKLGPKRFDLFKTAALSAMRKLLVNCN
ncbi:hypothetical protein KUTeg_001522, partial [Tegillarca granosa]